MSRDKLRSAVTTFSAFWLMYALFSLLGGQLDLTVALVFGASSTALAVIQRFRHRRKRERLAR
jgi:uncharacterized membrane protein